MDGRAGSECRCPGLEPQEGQPGRWPHGNFARFIRWVVDFEGPVPCVQLNATDVCFRIVGNGRMTDEKVLLFQEKISSNIGKTQYVVDVILVQSICCQQKIDNPY